MRAKFVPAFVRVGRDRPLSVRAAAKRCSSCSGSGSVPRSRKLKSLSIMAGDPPIRCTYETTGARWKRCLLTVSGSSCP